MTFLWQRRLPAGATLRAALKVCLLVWLSGISVSGAEVLVLESGDRLSGRSVATDAGYLRWEIREGEQLLVPLSWIERIDTDPIEATVPPSPTVAPPAPVTPDADVVPLLPAGPDLGAPEPSWLETVPFYDPMQEVVYEVGRGYEAFNDLASTWTRRINFGGQFINGNVQTDLINTQVEFENGTPQRMRQIDINGQWGRSNGRQTANKWIANGNFDWPLDLEDKWIMFFTSKNEYDAPANLNYRGTLSTGLGYRFFNEPKRRLISRFGPAYTIELFRDPYDHRESPDLFGEIEIRWPIGRRMSWETKTRVQPSVLNFELVRIFSNSALLVDLDDKDRWKLRLGFNYTYNSQPNPGRVPSDYVSIVSLMYTRK